MMNIYEIPKQHGDARNWIIMYYSFPRQQTGFSRHYERKEAILKSTVAYMHVMGGWLLSDK